MIKLIKSFRLITLAGFMCILMINFLYGQTNNNPFNETVDIVRAYKAKLAEANKMEISPVNEKLEIIKPILNFNLVPKIIDPPYSNSKLPAVSLIQNKTTSLDHFFFKAGAGNYSSLFGDFWYNTTFKKNDLFAANINYNSGKSSPKNSNYSEQMVQVIGTKYINNKPLSATLYFNNNLIHYYGYDHTKYDFSKDSVRQNYTTVGLKANFTNEMLEKDKIRYNIDGNFYNLNDAFNSDEICVDVQGKIEQTFQENPVNFLIGNTFFDNSYKKSNERDVFRIGGFFMIRKPSVKPSWNAQLGFKIASEADSTGSKFHFYPHALIEIYLIKNSLTAFGEVTGNLETLSYLAVTNENPYVRPDLDIRNTNNKIVLTGGFKGSVTEHINFLASISAKSINNLYFFINDSTDSKKFKIIYGNTSLLNLHLESTVNISTDINVVLSGNYYKYSIAYPWQKPEYDATISGRYNVQNKIIFNLDFLSFGKRYAYDCATKKAVSLTDIFDLNAGVTYYFSHTLGVFFNFNNILSDKYSYWNGYELKGFNFLGGIKANF